MVLIHFIIIFQNVNLKFKIYLLINDNKLQNLIYIQNKQKKLKIVSID